MGLSNFSHCIDLASVKDLLYPTKLLGAAQQKMHIHLSALFALPRALLPYLLAQLST